MKTERVNSLLAEIVSSQGFINIDQNDVDSFKANVGDIDAERFLGRSKRLALCSITPSPQLLRETTANR